MSFRKDVYQVIRAEKLFGRNVIVTDNHDWTTEEIVQLSLDRNIIEKQFRSGKAKEHVRMNPMYHWTDSKIRCHLLTCAIALTVLRLLELRVNRNRSEENRLSGKTILDEMSNLNLVTLWHDMRTNPETILEDPTKTQKEVLKAFGYKIAPKGVLQQSGS
jgi:transposase